MTHTWTRWNGEVIRLAYTGFLRTEITSAHLLQQIGEERRWFDIDYYKPNEDPTRHVSSFTPFPLRPFV